MNANFNFSGGDIKVLLDAQATKKNVMDAESGSTRLADSRKSLDGAPEKTNQISRIENDLRRILQ